MKTRAIQIFEAYLESDGFSLVADNIFTKFPQIKGTLWQTDGQYTMLYLMIKSTK
ncbi:MAG: hypothetical protein HZB73_04075 [Nitrosarchaeum sp.]|nr:hypothetical protein [Nitrosarchaeum sp.]